MPAIMLRHKDVPSAICRQSPADWRELDPDMRRIKRVLNNPGRIIQDIKKGKNR